MRHASLSHPFWNLFVPVVPAAAGCGRLLSIPVIERARGARWTGQAAETGEFPNVTVEAAGMCPSFKQEPV